MARVTFVVAQFTVLSSKLRRLSPRRRSRLRLVGHGRERLRVLDGELRQALAIESDARGFQTVDQLAVRQAVGAGRGVDADDPHAAEVALLAATARVGIRARLVDGLFRRLVQLALVEEKPLRALQQPPALGAANGSSFDSRHGSPSETLNLELRTQNGRTHQERGPLLFVR